MTSYEQHKEIDEPTTSPCRDCGEYLVNNCSRCEAPVCCHSCHKKYDIAAQQDRLRGYEGFEE